MKDRQVTHEGRRLIVPDSGTPFAATVYREKDGIDYEGIIEEGTPYNVESILPDTTAESLGLDPEADPTPADALQAIAQALIVPLDIQELYKPLIAPLSVSLSGFVEGSYLYYGIPWDSELRIFVRVSKTTAMSGATTIGTLPSGYRPTTTRNLRAYDTDGNIIADVIVRIYSTGEVSVIGSVDANTVVMASYNSSNSQSGGLTYKDIDRLISQNGAVIATNASYPAFDSGARWKKYADGTAEIDIQKTDTFAMTTNTGAGYYTQNANLTIPMPITLTHVDIFLYYLFGNSWGTFLQCYATGFPTEISYRVYRNISATSTNTIHFTIKGRWK